LLAVRTHLHLDALDEPKKAERSPRKMVPLTPDVFEALRRLAEQNERPVSWELRRILVAELERLGFWPLQENAE
jgi:hypothetical protein